MNHYSEVIDDLKEPTRSLSQAMPDTWGAFSQLHRAAVADGVLSAKVKELMALVAAPLAPPLSVTYVVEAPFRI